MSLCTTTRVLVLSARVTVTMSGHNWTPGLSDATTRAAIVRTPALTETFVSHMMYFKTLPKDRSTSAAVAHPAVDAYPEGVSQRDVPGRCRPTTLSRRSNGGSWH